MQKLEFKILKNSGESKMMNGHQTAKKKGRNAAFKIFVIQHRYFCINSRVYSEVKCLAAKHKNT